jgi:hypothetical protein
MEGEISFTNGTIHLCVCPHQVPDGYGIADVLIL